MKYTKIWPSRVVGILVIFTFYFKKMSVLNFLQWAHKIGIHIISRKKNLFAVYVLTLGKKGHLAKVKINSLT